MIYWDWIGLGLEDNMLAQLNLEEVQNIGLPHFLFRGGRSGNFGGIISEVLPYVFGAAGIALLIYLVMGGFQLMLSRGDPKAIQGAQGKITSALVGFIIVVTSFIITRLIGQLLGITIFESIFR